MKKLKFSKSTDQAKLKHIKEWSEIENPIVYSFSLLSGFSCPKALDCQSYAIENKVTGKRTLMDGKHAKFRCFSARDEARLTNVYNQRKHNFDTLLSIKDDYIDMALLIQESLPNKVNFIRVHVGGDFFNKEYMRAWYLVASQNPNIIFWGYTKSVKWLSELEHLRPENYSMNASYGGKEDSIIDELNLKSADVVFHPSETTKPIDKNEYYAIHDKGSFSLLLHGTQKAGSEASKALSKMIAEGIEPNYSKK
tara:strand:- start:72 stop:827 length:756 start_codon:yes stop_codon:yes gene_type:complete